MVSTWTTTDEQIADDSDDDDDDEYASDDSDTDVEHGGTEHCLGVIVLDV